MKFYTLRVDEIKKILRNNKLSVLGNKSELLERLSFFENDSIENKNSLIDSFKLESHDVVTVVILSWKRVDNIYAILDVYERMDIVNEIIIWNNNSNEDLIGTSKTKIINSSEDMGMRTRFLAGILSKNECIIFHDDDTLLPQRTIKGLYIEWAENPDIMHGLWGCVPKEDGSYSQYLEPPSEAKMIIGRCMVLKRIYCSEFFLIERDFPAPKDHSALNGCEDILMSYLIMSLTGKMNRCHPYKYLDLPYENAICRRPNHYEQRTQFMKKCEIWLEEIETKPRKN